MELNSVKAQKARNDYKAFLESLGVFKMSNPHTWQQLEQAFKFGYAKGAAENTKVEPRPRMEQVPLFTDTHIEIKDMAAEKKMLKKPTGRRYRTNKDLINDADIVKSILKKHDGPMQLQDIRIAANNAGCDWYPKSATGHMTKVMERHPAIKKVGFGLYEYQEKDYWKDN